MEQTEKQKYFAANREALKERLREAYELAHNMWMYSEPRNEMNLAHNTMVMIRSLRSLQDIQLDGEEKRS